MPQPPEALLLIAPGCPHCAGNLATLSDLVKEGIIGRLEVVNIAARKQPARALGVRSVPWTRIGPFELAGASSPQELRHWAEVANTEAGMAEYFAELLRTRGMAKVSVMVRDDPARLLALVRLLGDTTTEVHVRIGIAAVLEDLQDTDIARHIVPHLGALLRHDDRRVRHDACHFLALTRAPEAEPLLRTCLEADDEELREAAQEGIEDLRSGA